MRSRVLWIEDSARLELASMCGPVYFNGDYDFNLAEDVTTAIHLLQAEFFDVVIVDIRLPPGPDRVWRKLYQQAGGDKVNAQLGLKLLYWLLSRDQLLHPMKPPAWIAPERIAVFTVEGKRAIQKNLDELGITIFQQKVADLPDTILLQLIAQVLAQSEVPNG